MLAGASAILIPLRRARVEKSSIIFGAFREFFEKLKSFALTIRITPNLIENFPFLRGAEFRNQQMMAERNRNVSLTDRLQNAHHLRPFLLSLGNVVTAATKQIILD